MITNLVWLVMLGATFVLGTFVGLLLPSPWDWGTALALGLVMYGSIAKEHYMERRLRGD